VATRSKTKAPRVPTNAGHDRTVLVLQGGGALGSYQAGVYEGMAEAGLDPDWVTGVSIRAINAAPLEATLEELIDFDLINRKGVRLSLGTVNVRTGNSLYFDNRDIRIRPEHVMASGALPPGFPPVVIDGDYYWDGGIVSNTPLWYVLDDSPQMDALVVQVDLFNARGDLPKNMDEVLERAKDIQFSSKTRFNTTHVKEMEDMRGALARVMARLPKAFKGDPDVLRVIDAVKPARMTIAHLINRRFSNSATWKDYEFSRATMTELWATGLHDVREGVANRRHLRAENLGGGTQVVDMTR
jgi:NTE family protein